MIVGDPEAWADRFRSLDERLLERIAALWPACAGKLPSMPIEDAITINLSELLRQDDVVRQLFYWVQYHHEPKGLDPSGVFYSKGQMDLAAFLDQEGAHYLAYECKRLNVNFKSGFQSLATYYVTQGMMRFVTEQYAQGLAVGGMIGYVMDGDVSSARSHVDQAIASHTPLNKSSGPDALNAVARCARFCTSHWRANGSDIELRHAFLPFE